MALINILGWTAVGLVLIITNLFLFAVIAIMVNNAIDGYNQYWEDKKKKGP